MLVRSDLTPGLQTAQACHGIAEFAVQHPAEFSAWITGSNYIVILAVPDEDALLDFANVLTKYTLVHEPDIGEHTAIVVAPGPDHVRFTHLPLAGKELTMT